MRIHRCLSSIAVGLSLAGALGFSASVFADTTNLLARTTFDADGPAGWGYGYFYGDGGLGVYDGPDRAYYEPSDVENTNAKCRLGFDLSALAGNSNYGVGFGAPQYQPNNDPALFTSTNRADYLFSFDARVDGLRSDKTTSSAEMQVQFMNSAQTPNNILQVNLPFTPGAKWAHFTFHLDEGNLGADTSDKTFVNGYTGITALQFNVNLHLPSDSFDFDTDNAILIDNLVLEVIVRDSASAPPTTTFASTLADWNFDDKPIGYSYQYGWTEHGTQPTATANQAAPGVGVGGSNAWVVQMDNSALAADVPSWAGIGTGGEGPVDYSGFKSSDLGAYQVSFDAKIEGLAPDKASATAALQLFLRAPDNTILPSDTDTNRDLVVQLNFALSGLNPEWQSFTYTLSKGSVGGGSKTNFTAAYSKIDQVQTQWQIESGASESTWGFDTDNTLMIDNFKLERLEVGCPPLNISKSGSSLIATWSSPATGTTKLQSASAVGGAYTEVAGATSPFTVPINGGAKFYRTIWVPPAQ